MSLNYIRFLREDAASCGAECAHVGCESSLDISRLRPHPPQCRDRAMARLGTALLIAITLCGVAVQALTNGEQIVANINAYRATKGLPAVPISPALMVRSCASSFITLNPLFSSQYVAQTHVNDLNAAPPVSPCIMHGWSSAGGNWYSGCCYIIDSHDPTSAMVGAPLLSLLGSNLPLSCMICRSTACGTSRIRSRRAGARISTLVTASKSPTVSCNSSSQALSCRYSRLICHVVDLHKHRWSAWHHTIRRRRGVGGERQRTTQRCHVRSAACC